MAYSTDVRPHRFTVDPVKAQEVTDAFSESRRHPLLDHSIGGAFDRFRAVHDIMSHGWMSFDFSRDGEFSAWRFESNLYSDIARWALATELHAQHSVRWTTGDPVNYKATLLDPGLVTSSVRAGRAVADATGGRSSL